MVLCNCSVPSHWVLNSYGSFSFRFCSFDDCILSCACFFQKGIPFGQRGGIFGFCIVIICFINVFCLFFHSSRIIYGIIVIFLSFLYAYLCVFASVTQKMNGCISQLQIIHPFSLIPSQVSLSKYSNSFLFKIPIFFPSFTKTSRSARRSTF